MKVAVIIGTRPEAVKMLPLVNELKKHSEFDVMVCYSGQHEHLADNVFELFKTVPDRKFQGLGKGRSLNEMSAALILYYNQLFEDITPDIVFVHGDTTTALCASISAFHLGIRVAHVEAGLRTYDSLSPFPEEFNRVGIDAISSLHFAPTLSAAKNLRKEGRKSVFISGNTGIDAFKYTISSNYSSPIISEANGKRLMLITTHRRENLASGIRTSLLGIKDVIQSRNDVFAILPIHLNPDVQRVVLSVFDNVNNIKICPPLPLYDFHNLLSRSELVLSDSGGIQEEAAYLGIPLLLLRDKTERFECLTLPNVKIVGTEQKTVSSTLSLLLDSPTLLKEMRKSSLVFGNGDASKKIAKKLLFLAKKNGII